MPIIKNPLSGGVNFTNLDNALDELDLTLGVYRSFSVTNTLTNCTTSNSSITTGECSIYSATITATSGYTLTGASVSITMNGVDITSTAYNNGSITISGVSGNIVIVISAVQAAPSNPYLSFIGDGFFRLQTVNNLKNWDGTLQYSTDTTNWSVWDGVDVLASDLVDGEYVLYLRGTGNTVISGEEGEQGSPYFTLTGTATEIECQGNIENLLDYQMVANNQHPPMASFAFLALFDGCDKLVTIPELPTTTLADYCYADMFSDCIGLTNVSSLILPATTLAEGCYSEMFYNCSNLTSAPALPATALASSCYSYMFYGCTSLTAAPSLPATTLAEDCYSGMFEDCTSLTNAPTLSATTLASNCYTYMFANCSSLTNAPTLSATILADYCYANMFSDCTSLTSAPALSSITLAEGCYVGMFGGCTSLTSAPALPATTLAGGCYGYMFSGCTSLTSAPTLPSMTLSDYCYQYMFTGCTSLTSSPVLPATTLATGCYYHMFDDCTSLTSIPSLHALNLEERCYFEMFYNCSSIKLSETQTGEYQTPYRIPTNGVGVDNTSTMINMFINTGGTFTGTPTINTTYYLSNTNSVVTANS